MMKKTWARNELWIKQSREWMMEKAEEGENYKKAKKRMNDEKSWAGNEWWNKLRREWIKNTLFLVPHLHMLPLLYSQTAIFRICNECNWTMAAIDSGGQNGGNTWSGAAYLAPYLGIMQDSPPGVANVSWSILGLVDSVCPVGQNIGGKRDVFCS